MDPISFALAIAGIPALFKTSVEAFEYIQFAKNFGPDFGICLAKLEAAEMRLTRWGESMGLFAEPVDVDALFKKGNWEVDDIEKAKQWLGLIYNQFETAKLKSKNFQIISSKPADLEVIDEEIELKNIDPVKSLIANIRNVSIHRKNQTSIGKKIKWALYRKSEFDSLVEDISALVDNLTELFPFPALVKRQAELCKEEIRGINNENMPILIQVLGKHDKLLQEVLAREIKNQGLVFENLTIDVNGSMRLGNEHEYGSGIKPMNLRFTGSKISGSGAFNAGHIFRGPSSGR